MSDETLPLARYDERGGQRRARGLRSFTGTGRPAETGAAASTTANARAAAVAMLVAFGMFAVFNSQGCRHFTRDLPGNAATDILVDAADRWHGLMERLGPAKVGPAVREAFARVRSSGW